MPINGDAVYVAHRDPDGVGQVSALKLFIGWFDQPPTEIAPLYPYGKHHQDTKWLILKGWTQKEVGEPQHEYFEAIPKTMVITVAPVIFQRRRV